MFQKKNSNKNLSLLRSDNYENVFVKSLFIGVAGGVATAFIANYIVPNQQQINEIISAVMGFTYAAIFVTWGCRN